MVDAVVGVSKDAALSPIQKIADCRRLLATKILEFFTSEWGFTWDYEIDFNNLEIFEKSDHQEVCTMKEIVE
uniref:Uncharacterized protein n=1 Tax=Romanomermis culicivorax TaxID=13658 RepID=A0A915JR77_ROMCU